MPRRLGEVGFVAVQKTVQRWGEDFFQYAFEGCLLGEGFRKYDRDRCLRLASVGEPRMRLPNGQVKLRPGIRGHEEIDGRTVLFRPGVLVDRHSACFQGSQQLGLCWSETGMAEEVHGAGMVEGTCKYVRSQATLQFSCGKEMLFGEHAGKVIRPCRKGLRVKGIG